MTDTYKSMGVNVSEADQGIENIVKRIKATWPIGGIGKPQLDIGYFANVIDMGGGRGLASTTDGVGSKTIIAERMDQYNTIGIDCVAMNVNDLICVGATPVSMLDYIGVERADEFMLDQIAIGLTEGAKQAEISITGGEVSQLPDNIRGFDLVGAAFGFVDLTRINDGSRVQPGDVVIGVESNGIHSNGLTMARRVLMEEAKLNLFEWRTELNRSLGDELLRPTHIYVREILDLLEDHDVHALINITGDGLLNLNRIKAPGVGFVLDQLPMAPPIFGMIQTYGELDIATMYQTFNMGVGFCVVVPAIQVKTAINVLHSYGKLAAVIGSVVPSNSKSIVLPQHGLVGRGKTFVHGLNP